MKKRRGQSMIDQRDGNIPAKKLKQLPSAVRKVVHPLEDSHSTETSVISIIPTTLSEYERSIGKEALSIPRSNNWTHETFLSQTLPNEMGDRIPWMDVYYGNQYPRCPILQREFVQKYYYDVPVELLHAMYIGCSQENSRFSPIFQDHADVVRNYVSKTLESPNVYTLLLIYALASFYYMQQRSSKTVTYMGLAIRICHELGIHLRNDVPVYSVRDQTLQLDLQSTKRIMTYAWIFSYVHDFYYQAITGLPYSTHGEFNFDLLEDFQHLSEDLSKADK
jgi:hypothetical protein